MNRADASAHSAASAVVDNDRRGGLVPPRVLDEPGRLDALYELMLLDTLPEPVYDDLVLLAAQICGTPIGLMSLVDAQRQWFKARVGLDVIETRRDLAFCAYTIAMGKPTFIVEDALRDPRFADNPLVTGPPFIRFYAGSPIVMRNGHAIGTVCVVDNVPRVLNTEQTHALQALARQAQSLLELRLSNLTSAQQARVDVLTGLPNRRQFDERLSEALVRARRSHQLTAVMYLDIDNFKRVNDSPLGHTGGDAVLCEFARRLKSSVRAADVAARLAGDEFVVLLESVAGRVELERVAQKILSAVRIPFALAGAGIEVTTSVGVSAGQGGALNASELLSRADGALYRAKAQGRNRFVMA